MTDKYKRYLLSDEWKGKAQLIKETYGKCSLCGSNKFLNVHHRNYDNLYNEKLTDLICLCRDCHSKYHNKPTKINKTKFIKIGKDIEIRYSGNLEIEFGEIKEEESTKSKKVNGISNNLIIEYLKLLYNRQFWYHGYPTGYKKIERLGGFDKNIGMKIRSTLEMINIIGTKKAMIGTRKINVTELKMTLGEAITHITEKGV